MARTVKGTAIFLAQFEGDSAPLNSWKSISDGPLILATRVCEIRVGMVTCSTWQSRFVKDVLR